MWFFDVLDLAVRVTRVMVEVKQAKEQAEQKKGAQ